MRPRADQVAVGKRMEEPLLIGRDALAREGRRPPVPIGRGQVAC